MEGDLQSGRMGGDRQCLSGPCQGCSSCPMGTDREARSANTVLGGQGIAIRDMDHPASFEWSGLAHDAYMVVMGIHGEWDFHHGADTFRCEPESGVIVSPGSECRIVGQQAFGFRIVLIKTRTLMDHCAGWQGGEPATPPQFSQAPLSAELSRHWQQAIAGLQSLHVMHWVPEAALIALVEHALSLLVAMHPHDYSHYLHHRIRRGARRVKEARWLIENATEPLTLGTLAVKMRCTVVQLIMEFRRHAPDTSLELLLEAAWGGPEAPCEEGRVARTLVQGRTARTKGAPKDNHRLTASQAADLDDHISRNLGERITVADLSHRMELALPDFVRQFRGTFGVTPAQYVIRQRLEKAKRLLASSHMSIADVAVETGFSSHSHLACQFRHRMGRSPDQYRRDVRQRPMAPDAD
mgnify:CR=1 FL=1